MTIIGEQNGNNWDLINRCQCQGPYAGEILVENSIDCMEMVQEALYSWE